MSIINCTACEELRQEAPSLVVNGFDEDMCTSLENGTGLNPSSDSDNCTDLNNMNDCLVGNMAEELEVYEVCDWKEFMRNFIPNLWTTLKGMICALCGLQKNVKMLMCALGYMASGAQFHIGEDATADSYVVAGKGISFMRTGEGEHSTNISLYYVAGGFARLTGSLKWYQNNFTDAGACVNFDNGSVERTSSSRLGNTIFGSTGRPAVGGELLYEIRIKKSAYPQLAQLYGGIGHETEGGAYRVIVQIFNEGQYAYGNHGNCSTSTGISSISGHDSGHLVPEGWVYVQVRLTWADATFSNDTQYSPNIIMGVRLNPSEIPC